MTMPEGNKVTFHDIRVIIMCGEWQYSQKGNTISRTFAPVISRQGFYTDLMGMTQIDEQAKASLQSDLSLFIDDINRVLPLMIPVKERSATNKEENT